MKLAQGLLKDENAQLAERVNCYHPEGGSPERLARALANSLKPGKYLFNELREEGYEKVPHELQQELGQFGGELSPLKEFEPLAKGERLHVALVTAYDHEGKLLLGRRNDNQLYTLPGGHLGPGELPREAALRELGEETGLQALSLSPLTVHELPNGTILHCFSALVNGMPHGQHDPDRECDEWKFVDVSNGLPKRIVNKLHGPKDVDTNLLLRLFNIEERPETALAKSIADAWHQAGIQQASHWGNEYMAHEQAMAPRGRPANHMGEVTMPHLEHFEKAFNASQNSSTPLKPKDADIQGEAGYSPKVIHEIPVPGPEGMTHDNVRMMVKLAHWGACVHPGNMNGFRESTFQSVLHAGGMGGMVQRSFLAPYGTGKHRVAATVIPLDRATVLARCDESKWPTHPLEVQKLWKHQARLLALMDYVLGNDDRHSGNVMMRKMVRNGEGGVLAIDNGESLSYGKKCGLLEHMSQRNALRNLIGRLPIGGPPTSGGWTQAIAHWAQHSQAVRQAIVGRRHLVRNPVTRSNIIGGFEERAGWLDRLAADPRMASDDLTWEPKAHFDYLAELRGQRPHPPRRQAWQNQPLPSSSGVDSGLKGSFSKSIADSWHQAATPQATHFGHNIIHDAQLGLEKKHNALAETTMPHVQDLEDAYNKHIHTSEPLRPHHILAPPGETGYMPKVVHQLGDHHRGMVKPCYVGGTGGGGSGGLGAHTEEKVQRMAHAGGIGQHYQDSCMVTYGTGKLRVPATLIRLVKATTVGKVNWAAIPAAVRRSLHHSARQIALMDYLVGNRDRHAGNLMLRHGSEGALPEIPEVTGQQMGLSMKALEQQNGQSVSDHPEGKPIEPSLLAIDNGEGFGYESHHQKSLTDALQHNAAMQVTGSGVEKGMGESLSEMWKNSGEIRAAFHKQNELIIDPELRKDRAEGFELNAGWLDRVAADPRSSHDLRWESEAYKKYLNEKYAEKNPYVSW